MKNIKVKLSVFNRYLISFRNSIIKKIKSLRFFTEIKNFVIKQLRLIRLPREIKKILLFFIRLEFLQNIKFKTSIFSRYLILLIVLLFSYLFYLSIPALYNYQTLQKQLTTKLLKEFNLNVGLSADIAYRILPSPNFEIKNASLNIDSSKELVTFAQVKKMKVYISIFDLYDQKKIKVKKIDIIDTNFNIDNFSFQYIKNFFQNVNFNKTIYIKKSKIFFNKKEIKKEKTVALATIERAKIFFDTKDNNNKMSAKGSMYNTRYNLTFLKNIHNLNNSTLIFKMKEINTTIESNLSKISKNNYNGKVSIDLLGSGISVKYNIKDKSIIFSSEDSTNIKKNITFNGKISTKPFYYNTNIEIEKINLIKLIPNFFGITNLFKKNILLNNNFNGDIFINIKKLNNLKIFDQAKINIKFINGRLIFDDTIFIANKIGNLYFMDSQLIEKNNNQIFKSKIFFDISNQNKFYQKFQISKTNRIKLDNVYFEIEHNLTEDIVTIKKLQANSKIRNNSSEKNKVLSEGFDLTQTQNLKNWIKLKVLVNNIFNEFVEINLD